MKRRKLLVAIGASFSLSGCLSSENELNITEEEEVETVTEELVERTERNAEVDRVQELGGIDFDYNHSTNRLELETISRRRSSNIDIRVVEGEGTVNDSEIGDVWNEETLIISGVSVNDRIRVYEDSELLAEWTAEPPSPEIQYSLNPTISRMELRKLGGDTFNTQNVTPVLVNVEDTGSFQPEFETNTLLTEGRTAFIENVPSNEDVILQLVWESEHNSGVIDSVRIGDTF